MSGRENGRGSGAKRAPYIPTEAAVKAITQITGAIESLSAQDRGHVLSRLSATYLRPPKRVSSVKGGRQAAAGPARKLTWKVEFEKTEIFRKFHEFKAENRELLERCHKSWGDLSNTDKEAIKPYQEIQKEFVARKKAMQSNYYAAHGITKPKPSKPKAKKAMAVKAQERGASDAAAAAKPKQLGESKADSGPVAVEENSPATGTMQVHVS